MSDDPARTTVTVELIVGSVEVEKQPDGTEVPVKINRFASFTSSDGQKILFPWEELVLIVSEWMKVEGGGE